LIIQLNVDAIEFVAQGIPIIISENHVAEMLCLLNTIITKPLAMHFGEVANLCMQMAPLSMFVQKEGWKVSQLKGKYATRLSTLIQAI
jgi:hypothetical protein